MEEIVCPYVDSHVIVDAFNRYRRHNRATSGRPVNTHNTMRAPPPGCTEDDGGEEEVPVLPIGGGLPGICHTRIRPATRTLGSTRECISTRDWSETSSGR